jgi:hypothetical protein
MKIHTLDRLIEWNARRAEQSCNRYSYVYGARFEEQHIGWCNLIQMYSASDKTKLVDIQTTVELQGNTPVEAW